MRKTILSIIAVMLIFVTFLTGCNDTNNIKSDQETQELNSTTTNQKELIQLTKDNYSKYIATYTQYIPGDSYSYYYYNFVGSSLCKYNDVKIKYCLSNTSDLPETPNYKTCNLNISGFGQSELGYVSRYGGPYILIVVEVTGTVEILR